MIVQAVVGATGSGKTAFALRHARELGAEIISMDSRQVFAGFRIGTAQPTEEERAQVPHHLVDFLPPTESFSAGRFARCVKDILAQNPEKKFLLVGGTGLYLRALTEGLSDIPPAPPGWREEVLAPLLARGPDALFRAALEADPKIEGKLQKTDTQRLSRVLEVRAAGRVWSDTWGERVGGIGIVPVLWLDPPRAELYARIDARVERMFAQGWEAEARALAKTVPMDAPAWLSLGYREIVEGGSRESVRALVAQKTRQYAKRQLTWFRGQLPENTERINTPMS
jgi:tRNA dimethylallyltransferase